MNKQEIINLKPGKELDKLVKEKVLGLTGIDSNQLNNDFSTNPREIWTIVEGMIKRNFIYTLSNSQDKHVCAFDNLNTHRRFIVHAETLIEAICKASLLAMEDYNKKAI